MEFQYSTEVDPSTYDTEGLCEGIPLRVHKYPDLEDIGTLRAQEDWRRSVGPVENYKGGLGPKYSFMSVAVPECLPERLEIISYANEFAFLHDDITDNIEKEKADVENDQMLDALEQGALSGSIESKHSGKRQIQANMLLEMLKIDRERALTSMKLWARFVELAAGRQHDTQFASLDEYIPYRIIDVGEMFWFAVVTFGMAITIPEEEMDLCRRLMRPAWIVAGLTNDLFSWQKEYEASIRNGQSHVVNAIWVLTREHSITVDEAKYLCRQKIKEHIADYVRVVKENRDNMDLSLDLRKYIDCMQYSLSGNVVWSRLCPRYHPTASYNELQLARMNYGVEKYPVKPYELFKVSDRQLIHNDGTSSSPAVDVIETNPPSTNGSDWNKHVNGVRDMNGASRFDGDGVLAQVNGTNGIEPKASTPMVHTKKVESLVTERNLPMLSDKVVLAPYEYVSSLPSKGVREQAIDAFNVWVRAPLEPLNIIKSAINRLHNASLMLDDLEDMSPLRRGRPSTHTIFGEAQTINAANYQIIEALNEVRQLGNPICSTIFIEELKNLYVGQSLDLHWTYNLSCPSVEDYLTMVDYKTGGLFRLLSKLLTTQSTGRVGIDLCDLATLLGRYFQIRDDYQNLVSIDYTKQKGFCEDLDEGKYSLPLIHTLHHEPQNMQLRGVLLQRHAAGQSTPSHKQFVLEQMKRTKSLEVTASLLKTLHDEIGREIDRVEEAWGTKNFSLRLLLDMLRT